MILFALLSLIFSQSGAKSSEYYCPHYDDILLGETCYRPFKNVLKRNDAESLCTSLNKKLLDTSVDQISGWLQSTSSTRNLITEDYCVYAYTKPQGVLSPDNPLYKLALCPTPTHFTQLSVLCSTLLQTGSSCASGWSEAVRDTYKYCVQPSVKTKGGGELLTEDICPEGTDVFEFDYQTPTEDLTYTTTEESLPKLLKPFWTPYYLRSGKTVHRYTKVEARSLESCLYKFTNTDVSIMSCDKELPFHCQSPAKLIAEEQYVEPDTYDPVKEYLCEEDEILCENKCYQHRKVYETLDKASVNCTEGGYKLVTRNVPCIDYQSGWVEGSFEEGRLKIRSSQSLDSLCGYVEGGETKLADCRMKAKVLCQVTLKSAAEACPAGYTKCSKKTECVAESTSDTGLSWSEAIQGIHMCGNGGRLLDSRSSLEDCKAAIPTNAALWVGASLSKGNVVEFSSGEEVTISTPKKCLQVRGGKLLTSDCGDLHYFACERLAEVKDEETSSTDTAIVVTLIISPLVLIGVVLALLYKKKGKQMCLSDTTADLEPADTGLTIINPIMDKAADQEQVIIEPVEDEGPRAEGSMEKSREMKNEHGYVNRAAGASGEKSLEVESEYEYNYTTTSIGANPLVSANPSISANPNPSISANPSLGTDSSIRAEHEYVNRADI